MRIEYETLDTGKYRFLLAELAGIWDQQATVDQRINRASWLAHVLPGARSYVFGIGLVPRQVCTLPWRGDLDDQIPVFHQVVAA